MADTLQHNLRAFRIRELQYVLKQFGLPHSGGRKADLLQRVQTYIECALAPGPLPHLPCPALAHVAPICPIALVCFGRKQTFFWGLVYST